MRYEDFTIHPLADAFPLIEGEDFDQLVQSIESHGLIDPIVRLDGVVIDGRNRLRACCQANKEPRFHEYDFPMEIHEYIWSKNVDRRHLDEDQRAVVVLAWEDFEREQARTRQQQGAAIRDGDLVQVPAQGQKTRDALAERADVSTYKIEQARTVKRHDEEHGTDLVKRVEKGEIKLRDAERQAKGEPEPKQAYRPRGERAEAIRGLAVKGYRSEQIAAELDLSDEYVRRLAKEEGIPLTDAVIGKTRRLDVNRIVNETVMAAHSLTAGLELIDSRIDGIDRAQLPDWIETLAESISALNKLLRTLRRIEP